MLEPSPSGKGSDASGTGMLLGWDNGAAVLWGRTGVGHKGEGWHWRHPVTSPQAGSSRGQREAGRGSTPLTRITGVKAASTKAYSPHPLPATGL